MHYSCKIPQGNAEYWNSSVKKGLEVNTVYHYSTIELIKEVLKLIKFLYEKAPSGAFWFSPPSRGFGGRSPPSLF
ncbi:MAG: hypothetical protein EBS07_11200 [Sphingobacteriia bacterium]|nr:hypothetical protein [Sphingobacteriia bacterium]